MTVSSSSSSHSAFLRRARVPGSRLAAAGLLAATLCGAPGTADANGRYPAAGLIAVDPSDPDHIVVRATYGLLSTEDGGKTWRWTCEQAIGFSDNEDPMIAIAKNGTLLAGVFKGLSVSTDRGCDWSYIGGDLEDRYVIDLATEKPSPDRAVAIASNGIGGGLFKTQVFETTDNGATWQQAGTNLPEEFLGLTIDVAPSDPNRLYASGRYGSPDYQGAIERSDDRGQTWQHLEVTGSNDKSLPYLSAIDPNDPDVLYVRLDWAEADALIVSKDGGASWEQVFAGQGALPGFALSPDGSKVAIGGDKDGIWIAPTSTLEFTKVSPVRAKCLLWTSDTFFACADEFKDGFTVGVSKNEGATFEPLHHLREICPLECPAGTTTAESCEIQWGALALTIDALPCDEPDAGAPTSVASAGSSNEEGPGCSCGVENGGATGGSLLLAAAALSAALRRRRRYRRGVSFLRTGTNTGPAASEV